MNHMLLEQLKERRCDVDGAIERCQNDEAFYLECVKMVMEDQAFLLLGQALEKEDAHSAFEYAHGLKGVLSNVGFTSLYDLLVPIVESLRVGNVTNVSDDYGKFMQEYEKLKQLIETDI